MTFCGTGHQVIEYCEDTVNEIRSMSNINIINYYTLVGTSLGLATVQCTGLFNEVRAVFELDDSFKVFSTDTRYFPDVDRKLDIKIAKDICQQYGTKIENQNPLGYGDCQLLLGFSHNTPDNSLPIFWSSGNEFTLWEPIFKRYNKSFGWYSNV